MLTGDALRSAYEAHIETLVQRTELALRRSGYDSLLVHSGRPLAKSIWDDQFWPLRTNPHFQHWLPLFEADHVVRIQPGKRPTLFRNTAVSFWEGPAALESDHFFAALDVIDVRGLDDVAQHLDGAGRAAVISEHQEAAEQLTDQVESWNPPQLLSDLEEGRVTKTAYELECIAEANRRALAGHRAVLAAFADGDYSELELHLIYLKATSQDDPETPYKNIVALGEHAATLHHVAYGRRATGAQSLLLDAGATCLGYHSDITRTASKGSGAAADTFAGLIEGLDVLQQETCAQVRKALPYERLHDLSHELLAPLLRSVGIGKGSSQELVDTGITRAFFPHGLGHSLGLQTHDVGCARIAPSDANPFLRNTRAVEPGQCFTIEPGVYFIDALLAPIRAGEHQHLVDWSVVDALTPFGGVRIEDDIAISADGAALNFTRDPVL